VVPATRALDATARELSRAHRPLRDADARSPLPVDIARVSRTIERAMSTFRAIGPADAAHGKAAEWFLDNHYLLVRAVRQVATELPMEFRRRLPHVAEDEQPRVLRLARAIVQATSDDFDEATILDFVGGYQERSPLTIAELWALPLMLRIAVLETLVELLAFLAPSPRSVSPERALDVDPAVAMGHVVRALRQLSEIDWRVFVRRTSLVEATLVADPAGVYPRMDFDSCDTYRKAVEELAWGAGRAEHDVARLAIRLASNHRADTRSGHVGYYLVGDGRPLLEEEIAYRARGRERWRRVLVAHPTPIYLGSVVLSTSILLAALVARFAAGLGVAPLVALGVLAVVPIASLVVAFTNWAITTTLPPRTLAKLDFSEGIPEDCKTAVVVPALVSSPDDVNELLGQLELHFLSNPDPSLVFVLLTDHVDSLAPPDDAALLAHAERTLAALNQTHGDGTHEPFHMLHRDSVWNESEGRFMGWERKRGKLQELNQLLRGSTDTSFGCHLGDPDGLVGVRFVITLDADTRLPLGGAHKLVGLLAHPLNQALFDPRTGRVTAGYTLVQPRVEPSPMAQKSSWFSRTFMGDTALDIYTRAVSDVYQDLFGSGVYVGKGIYEVDSFVRSVGQVPENALVSHDLFEGIHGRVALATDIVLFEEYPHHYLAYAQRLHRWTRGDWQLLPWLVLRRSRGEGPFTLRLIDRWKIADNLRRSLLPPSLLVLMVLGWVLWPGRAGAWSAVVLTVPLAMSLPSLMGPRWGETIARWLFGVAMLPVESVLAVDAVGRALVRMAITRRHLLEWVSAATISRQLDRAGGRGAFFSQMAWGVGLAGALCVGLAIFRPSTAVVLAPLLLLWVLSPELAYRASGDTTVEEGLEEGDRRRLRLLARRTWLFFETFVGPADQWLPPDNYQLDPERVAHRTSPTNIGLSLTAQLAARDLGYIGPAELAARLHQSVDSVLRLERHRGHWLNWYETKTRAPLLPRYVSTVDSGNLAACLLTVAAACRGEANVPILGAARWDGLADALQLLEQAVHPLLAEHSELSSAIATTAETLASARSPSAQVVDELDKLSDADLPAVERALLNVLESTTDHHQISIFRRARTWLERLRHQVQGMCGDAATFLPWLALQREAREHGSEAFGEPVSASEVSLGDVRGICAALRSRMREQHRDAACPELRAFAARADAALERAQREAGELTAAFAELALAADAAWKGMDFSFLFDEKRRLFRIGHDATTDRPDRHYYDLLASEARLASFLAVVLNQVPTTHWHTLGRPVTTVDGAVALLSWGGTMFEYLLPPVFMRSADGTLLRRSEQLAVAAQIEYRKRTTTPWGISESGYAERDVEQNYQYRSFGVPTLALQRGLEDDLVIAPYACVLALRFRPRQVMDNLDAIEELGASGMYGLFEAIDFHPLRGEESVPDLRGAPRAYAVVRSHMAHHQGMILAALDNALNGDVLVERFHAEPLVKCGEVLLNERLPSPEVAETTTLPPKTPLEAVAPATVDYPGWSPEPGTPRPSVALLTNGRLTTLISDTGAGFTQFMGMAITGGAPDATRDSDGFWIYLRDERSGDLWSVTPAPTRPRNESDRVVFEAHKVEFHHRRAGVSIRTEIAVAPLDDVEIRHVTLHNETEDARSLVVASHATPILEPAPAAARHPAFSRMFVECEMLPDRSVLASRRKKDHAEAAAVMVQQVVWDRAGVSWLGCGLDRERFVGRRRDCRDPLMDLEAARASQIGDRGAIDPAVTLALEVALEPHATIKLAFVTAVGKTRGAAVSLARRFGSLHAAKWGVRDAKRSCSRRLERGGIAAASYSDVMRLSSMLLVPEIVLGASEEVLRTSKPSKRGLWQHGISGDHPLLVVRVDRGVDDSPLIDEVLATYRYMRACRMPLELVFLDKAASGYQADGAGAIRSALARTNTERYLDQRGGIFLLAEDRLGEVARDEIAACARVYLDGDFGSLREQWLRLPPARLPIPLFSASNSLGPDRREELSIPALLHANEHGGFTEDGREYVVHLRSGRAPPAPWCNVLANPDFGCLVSESSLGSTWASNSGEHRLTPWRNDPISDTPSEALYLRDEATGRIWSPSPLPAGLEADTLVRHGAGYTHYERDSHGLGQTMTVFVPSDAPVKIIRLRLDNHSGRPRRLTATYYLEWVLGALRAEQQPHVRCEVDTTEQCVLATCAWNEDFRGRTAFVAADRSLHGFTCDRSEFLGQSGQLSEPEALARWGLAGSTEPGRDPCAALQVHVELAPGEVLNLHFVLGEGRDRAEALALVRRFRQPTEVDAAWGALHGYWDGLLGSVQVKTPEPELDVMLNRWLLYQSVASRFFARSAFYQSSGAFGFRDQLQDVMALSLVAPQNMRAHLLEAASHQFEEGDVLHWWHPPVGRGVRTRCSDDLVWLPFVVAHYVAATDDLAVLSEQIPFLEASPLQAEEHDRYDEYRRAEQTGDLFEHCRRALDRGFTKGPNGLPLIGEGDWNDGMNRVGVEGLGESVWLGWFLIATARRLAPLAERLGHEDDAERWRQRSVELAAAIEEVAWDGDWYLRAFYDDGSPIGAAGSRSCQIDSIAQSWATLSGAARPERAQAALRSADERLVRARDRLVLLLEPPFGGLRHDPGYIGAYPAGVRENGGQYSHAAAWLGWAHAVAGDGDAAANILRLLNPVSRARSHDDVERYRVEPYVLAGDIYSIAPQTGRGGWTWYTGAAAWTWRLGIEAILGLHADAGGLRIDPCIPRDWAGFEARLRLEGREVHVVVDNPDRVSRGVRRLTLDGIDQPSPRIELSRPAGSTYEAHVVLGPSSEDS